MCPCHPPCAIDLVGSQLAQCNQSKQINSILCVFFLDIFVIWFQSITSSLGQVMVKQVTAEKVKILFTDGKTWFFGCQKWFVRVKEDVEALRPNDCHFNLSMVLRFMSLLEEGLLAFPNPGEGLAGRTARGRA